MTSRQSAAQPRIFVRVAATLGLLSLAVAAVWPAVAAPAHGLAAIGDPSSAADQRAFLPFLAREAVAVPAPTQTPTSSPSSTPPAIRTATPAASPTATATIPAGSGPSIAGCPQLPLDNVWNTRVDTLPVHARSDDYVNSIGRSSRLKADFGSGLYDGGPIGIPYTVVPGSQPKVPVSFEYADESDPGPYPIPTNAPIEGGAGSGGDRHILVVDRDNCVLYETWSTYPRPDGSWRAGSGAVFPLTSNALRPAGWTSADAAGLPILPGLARYDEVAAGAIKHALRFTAPVTQRAYVWPARHDASSNTSQAVPPMGARLRLKASFDISGYSPRNQVILKALKTYGLILADNGSSWYVSGAPDERWDNDDLQRLRNVTGDAFEVVDAASLQRDPDSGAARRPPGW